MPYPTRPRVTHCLVCDRPITQPARGRPRKTCSDACRQRYSRRWRHSPSEADFQRRRRAAIRQIARWDKQFGPLDPAFKGRLLVRLPRGINVLLCRHCGRPFINDVVGRRQQFCSTACRCADYRRRQRERALFEAGPIISPPPLDPLTERRIDLRIRRGWPLRRCPACHSPFIVDGYTGRPRIYCSTRCRQAMYRHRRAQRIRRCPTCGREYAIRAPHQVYCSVACRRRARDIKRRKNLPPRACRVCGQSFKPTCAHHVYCSAACRRRARRARLAAAE